MRILHTIHSLSPESGGPAEGLRRLAERAHTAGVYETEMLSLDDPRSEFLKNAGAPAHAVGPGLGKYGYTQRMDRWLAENLSRFDGVVINGLWQYHARSVWKACRGKVPYIVFTHGMLDPWFRKRYPLKHLKKAVYWGLAENRVLRDATCVMFTASLEAELAKQSFWPSQWKSVVIPYGTVEPPREREPAVREFFAICPKVRERAYFLFLGRLHEKKGCDLLIDAFAQYSQRYPNTDLVMAGPDQQGWKVKLVAMAARHGLKNRVHFPGMLQGGAKWGAFHAAQAFVLPSHQENFGIAVAEALACSTPVLISNKVNIWREILEDSVGFVDDDDLPGTLRLLESWAGLSPTDRVGMTQRCHASFQKRFDIRQAPKIIAEQFHLAHSTKADELRV